MFSLEEMLASIFDTIDSYFNGDYDDAFAIEESKIYQREMFSVYLSRHLLVPTLAPLLSYCMYAFSRGQYGLYASGFA